MRALPVLLALCLSAVALAQPEAPGPRYVIEEVRLQGLARTEPHLVLREVGLAAGDLVERNDPRLETARLRLLSLGYFLDVQPRVERGSQRGTVVVVFEVVERGTAIINAIYLGISDATPLWAGLDVTETNFLGRGLSLGGGFVQSARPEVTGADAGTAISLRAAGPPPRSLFGLSLSGSFLWSSGSEFFRAAGPDDSSRPADFVAARTRRLGGALTVGTDLSRATRVFAEGRVESIRTTLPDVRSRTLAGGERRPILFGIQEGASLLSALSVGLDVDTRDDPVLPRRGGHAAVTLQTALPVLGSRYSYAKGLLQASRWWPVGRHAVGVHGLAGATFGEAPYFERFFVGDLNLLLPPRALGLNFSTQPSRDLLGTSVDRHRYDDFAVRALVEYAVPLWRGRGFFYRADAFVAFGAFALGSADDMRLRDEALGQAFPADLTADVGVRLDTFVGIFTLSFANALGRLPL